MIKTLKKRFAALHKIIKPQPKRFAILDDSIET